MGFSRPRTGRQPMQQNYTADVKTNQVVVSIWNKCDNSNHFPLMFQIVF